MKKKYIPRYLSYVRYRKAQYNLKVNLKGYSCDVNLDKQGRVIYIGESYAKEDIKFESFYSHGGIGVHCIKNNTTFSVSIVHGCVRSFNSINGGFSVVSTITETLLIELIAWSINYPVATPYINKMLRMVINGQP